MSTDKVDPEPRRNRWFPHRDPSTEGETAAVGTVLAVIGDEASRTVPASAPEPVSDPEPVFCRTRRRPRSACPRTCSRPVWQRPMRRPWPRPRHQLGADPGPSSPPASASVASSAGPVLTSPVVRRLIAEHGLDPAQIKGTGEGGRITRNDVARRRQRIRPDRRPRRAAYFHACTRRANACAGRFLLPPTRTGRPIIHLDPAVAAHSSGCLGDRRFRHRRL